MSTTAHYDDELNASLAQGSTRALELTVAKTRELDTLDVLSGRRRADALHFISRSMACQTTPVFPRKYLKS